MGLNPAVAFYARMILRLLGALLLSTSLCVSSVFANELCESEIRAVNVLVKMVRNAMAAGELNVQDVSGQFAGENWVNPFALQTKTLKNLDRRKAFANVSQRFTAEQKREFRSKLLFAIDQLAKEKNHVETATKSEAYIFLPKIFAEVPQDFSGSGQNLFAMGVIDERPVFVGLMTKNNKHSEYLIDYFRKDDPDKKIHPVGSESKLRDSFDGVGKIFSWNKTDYFVRLESQTFINLRTGENVKNKFSKLQAPRNPGNSLTEMQLKGWSVWPTSSGLAVVAAWNAAQTELNSSFLGFVNLDSRAFDFSREAQGATRSDISMVNIGDQAYVSWIPRGENRAHFYRIDGSRLELLGSPSLKTESANIQRQALVYASGDKLLAAIPYDHPDQLKKHRIGIFDVREGYLRDISLPTFEDKIALEMISVNGRRMLQVVEREQVHLVDLETEKTISHKTAKLRTRVTHFHFRGRTFFVWGTDDSKLEIHDAETGLLVGSLHIGNPAIQILPFEIHGEPFAFVPRAGKVPIFVRLMDNGEEFKW